LIRFVVYCTNSLNRIDSSVAMTWLRRADFYILAEAFGIEDDDAVKAVVASIRVGTSQQDSSPGFEVNFGDARRVIVRLISQGEELQTELTEAREVLTRYAPDRTEPILAHFENVVDLAEIECSWRQLQTFGGVIAGQVAECLAEHGNGLIRDPSEAWWRMENGAPKPILKSSG
jgi:hypothetical protein